MALTDQTCIPRQAPLAKQPAPSLWQMLTLWRTRRQLRGLDASQLADVGISAKAAETEANRPLWDVPATWRN